MTRLSYAVVDVLGLAGLYLTAAGVVSGLPWLAAGGLGLMTGCVLWLWRRG